MTTTWLIGILLIAAPVFGQGGQTTTPRQTRPDGYSIRGKMIIGTNRDGDARIEVRLERTSMQVIQTTFTDSVGNFEFRNLSPGVYNVSANVDGYEPVRQAVDVYPNVSIATANIFLNRIPPERPRLTGVDAADPDIVDISQMKENFPKKATQNFEKALEEKKKGQTDKAIKLLEEAVELAPTFYHAHNNLGILYQGAKRFGDAEKHFRRSRELNPKAAEPLTNLGSLFIEMSEARKGEDREVVGKLLDDAMDVLEAAVKINPRAAVAYYYLGAANYKSAFYEEAEVAYNKALELDPSMIPIRLMLANIYMKQSRWQEVVGSLDAYLKGNPKASDRASIEATRAKILREIDTTNNR